MTITESLLREIQILPEQQQAEVLSFARFLRFGLSDDQRFESALHQARGIARERGITEVDISTEIEKVRQGN